MKDKEKDDLAISNGVNIIRINLKEDKINASNIDTIINRVKESGISKIINLSTIDWDVCLEYSRSNLKLCASDLWNEGLCISEISKEMKLSKSTICKYLKYMKKCGQNNYTKEESCSRGVLYEKRNRRTNCKN
jgi:response regulator of citrate/malate metabolism